MKHRRILKVLCLGLACAMTMSTLVGCGGGGSEGEENEIFIKYYNGAYGEEWIWTAANDFVEEKAKQGIKVSFDIRRDTNMDTNVQNEVGTGLNLADMYMVRDCNWTDFVREGRLEDLTSVYETVVNTSQGPMKIKDYMSDGYNIQYYAQRQAGVGNYVPWAMPWSASQIGLVYNENILKSMGRDNPPETITELLQYCDDLVEAGITPFIFPGQEDHWFKYLIQVWWAQYQGVTEENLDNVAEGDGAFYDFYKLESIDVLKQKGIQKGIDTMQSLFVAENGGWKNSDEYVNSYKVADAEKEFVDNEKAAMLVGASFMYNEVRQFIRPGAVYKMMSLPTIDGALKNADGKTTAKINYYTSEDRILIPKGAMYADLAKEFLAFMCNEKYLLDFISKTGTVRPFKYDPEVLDAEALGLNEFNASVLDVYKQSDIKLVSLPANLKTPQERPLVSLYKNMPMNGAISWGIFIDKIKKNQSSASIMNSIYNDTVPEYNKWMTQY